MTIHPAQIERLQQEIAELNLKIQKARESIGLIEADITLEVSLAKDENSKPLFSNDTIRRAAFVKKIAEHSDHRVLSKSIAESEYQKLLKQAHLERLRLEFKLFLLDREVAQ